jgi:hypothetical protein
MFAGVVNRTASFATLVWGTRRPVSEIRPFPQLQYSSKKVKPLQLGAAPIGELEGVVMPPSQSGMIWQIAIGSFGVAAAILLVGGWVLLRYQRDRQHFQLMQAALDRGVTSMPGMVAGWVVSLRQGFLALMLGLGLVGAGLALDRTADRIEPAPVLPTTTAPARPMDDRPFPPPPGPMGRREGGDPMRDGPPGMRDGPPRDGQRMGMPDGPPPPRWNPAMERWQSVKTQKQAGLVTMCAGGILALLGLVRIAFSRLERKYVSEINGLTSTPK